MHPNLFSWVFLHIGLRIVTEVEDQPHSLADWCSHGKVHSLLATEVRGSKVEWPDDTDLGSAFFLTVKTAAITVAHNSEVNYKLLTYSEIRKSSRQPCLIVRVVQYCCESSLYLLHCSFDFSAL